MKEPLTVWVATSLIAWTGCTPVNTAYETQHHHEHCCNNTAPLGPQTMSCQSRRLKDTSLPGKSVSQYQKGSWEVDEGKVKRLLPILIHPGHLEAEQVELGQLDLFLWSWRHFPSHPRDFYISSSEIRQIKWIGIFFSAHLTLSHYALAQVVENVALKQDYLTGPKCDKAFCYNSYSMHNDANWPLACRNDTMNYRTAREGGALLLFQFLYKALFIFSQAKQGNFYI